MELTLNKPFILHKQHIIHAEWLTCKLKTKKYTIMKKLFLTFILLLSFVNISNAKTKVLKNTIKKEIRKIDCECLREDTYYSAINNGATVEEANIIAGVAFFTCKVWSKAI